MWGLLFVIGWALSCLCFVVMILAYLSDKVPMNRVIGKRHFHDLGKLMLALVMVWAYFNFSQFLIIWSGNIPEETGWYIDRMQLGWGVVGMVLVLFHFAAPFLILLKTGPEKTCEPAVDDRGLYPVDAAGGYVLSHLAEPADLDARKRPGACTEL